MSDPVAEFLAKQKRYMCDRLSASLTIEQCEQNRTREANIQKGINNVMQCEGCTGLGKAIEIKERVMATVKKCEECGEVKKIHAYGRCSKCLYKKYGKSMKPPQGDDLGSLSILGAKDDAEVIAEQIGAAANDVMPAATPFINPLLRPVHPRRIVLDLSAEPELWSWLQEWEVTTEHIIELLNEARGPGLMVIS